MDFNGIYPLYFRHKNLREEEFKPVTQPQRRLNPTMNSKKISCAWVNIVQVVLKKEV